jgi:DNA replication protein DnaC
VTQLGKQALDAIAGCNRCEGVGLYYDPTVDVGRFGQLRQCACVEGQCRCRGQRPYQYWDAESRRHWCPCRPYRRRLEETGALFRQADLPERFRWKLQDDFHRVAQDGTPIPLADRVMVEVGGLIEARRPPVRGYLLHGGPGAGKTLLGCIMLNELMLRWCRPGRFLNLSRKYFERLRDTYSEDSEHYGKTWQMMEELCNMPFLMLDDLGTQRNTEWELEMLYNLVDARYGDERFTVVTTNKPLDEIREIAQGRIYSRLAEMCKVMEMHSVDYREHRVW